MSIVRVCGRRTRMSLVLARITLFESPSCGLPFRTYPTVPGSLWEARHAGVSPDVLHDPVQVFLVSHDSVEALLLPECSASIQSSIGLPRNIAFHVLENDLQRVAFGGPHHKMHMVRHDFEARDKVTVVLELEDRITHQLSDLAFRQFAVAITFVEPLFCASRDFFRVLMPLPLCSRFGIIAFPNLPPTF